MNIYKLKNEELQKYRFEFNKTAYGKKIALASTIPAFFAIIFFALFVIIAILQEYLPIEESLNIIQWCSLILANFHFGIACLAQLNYSKLLKEYIESKK